MSYKSRIQSSSDITNISSLVSADGKIDKAELQSVLAGLNDSTMWIDANNTISYASTFTYNCSTSSLQTITLTGNATMVISNAVAGNYYTLIVIQDSTGSRTLTLPTGKTSGSLGLAASSHSVLTFMYSGTNYYFSLASYS